MENASPRINDLQPVTGPELDNITISSNSGCERSDCATIENMKLTSARDQAPRQNATPSPSTSKITRKKRKNNGPGYLQEAEIERFFKVIKAVGSPRDMAIFRLSYHAGLRASEVGMLEVRDHNPRTERMAIHRLKGSNSGDHHMCREESKAVKAWLKIRGSEPGALFPSRQRGAISRKMLDVLMKKYGRLCGLPVQLQHFHVLKHSCCTHLLNRGFNIEQVQDWVGHARIQNTMVYGKVTNSRRSEMAKALRETWR